MSSLQFFLNIRHAHLGITLLALTACASSLAVPHTATTHGYGQTKGANAALKNADEALTALTSSMVWQDNQCVPTYNTVLAQNSKAQTALTQLRATLTTPRSYKLASFIDQQLSPKLTLLNQESSYLRTRCAAPDYDNSSFSLERPAMLRAELAEFSSVISQLQSRLPNPPDPKPLITRASLTHTVITPKTLRGTTFKDCTDAYCPELTVIPNGQFSMGGTAEEQARENITGLTASWETPRHSVTILKPFAMNTYETTLGEFKQFAHETGWKLEGCRSLQNGADGLGPQSTFGQWYNADLNYQSPGYSQTDQYPVLCVRREDAIAYANWLSQKTGQHYRLPSEAEWEYAARAETTTAYYWGDDVNKQDACRYANVYDTSSKDAHPSYNFQNFNCNDSYPYAAPVGQFLPNNFGLHDMSANGREWVADCWHPSYSSAPNDGSVWGAANSGVCLFPVLRGGGWPYNTFNVRIAYRNAYFSSQTRSNMWGFRLVRNI